jgi:penicillin-binding protein 1C
MESAWARKKLLRWFLLTASVSLALLLSAFAFLLSPLPRIPSFQKVRSTYLQSEGVLLDRNGDRIHELRIHAQGRRLNWTALRDISPALQSAVLTAEDRRFYRHGGVDWISALPAVLSAVHSSRTRGASTITMQLTALGNENLKPDDSRRSLFQKIIQIRAARGYEKAWSKAEILEAYLNLVTFRGELQGIAAAARGLFFKEPQGLNDVESVILASLLRSPNSGTGTVAARADALARAMHLSLKHSDLEAAVRELFSRPYYVRPQVALAPHVALRLFAATGNGGDSPAAIACTLDGRLQAFAADVLRRQVLSAQSRNMHDGAVLVVENKSGDVLAYAGNIGEQASARFVDGIRAMRQAGSTLKPFVYALAFDSRILTPASLLDDSPLDIPAVGGVYRPRNYDNRFHGMVTARVALASSLNVPAVKTLDLVGVDVFVESLRRLGFEEIRNPEFYGPSLALGSADVSLWDLVNAYRAVANCGNWSALRLTPNEPAGSGKRVFSAEAAFLISEILSDRESRSRTFDLESPLSTRFWTAVKTGTSKDMRDNWCVGFSDRYTVGVWAGNFSGEPMWNVTGITGAAPAWIEIMNRLHRRELSRKPNPPAGLVQKTIDFPGTSQSKQEWFIRGTETMRVQDAQLKAVPKIVYPTAGSVIALDPDIPLENQRIFFEAEPEGNSLEWFLDGQSVGTAATLASWPPRKGRHVLVLSDNSGKELDSVTFEVRGN